MKKVIAVFLLALSFSMINAQEAKTTSVEKPARSIMYRKGYRADIGLHTGCVNLFGITSSHGYSFGNGIYVGGGTGFYYEFATKGHPQDSYMVPVFADIKYTTLNRRFIPFVQLRVGETLDFGTDASAISLRTTIHPMFGVDLDRFSIRVGYEYQIGTYGHDFGVSRHYTTFGVSVSL